MLDLRDLDKTYPNGVHALQQLSLRVGNGIFGLLGPNGAGKSSLLRTIATLQTPDRGSVHLDGQDLLADPAAARVRIGYLPQDFGLYPQVSAESLLDQFALYKGIVDRTQRRQRVADCLAQVNLSGQARQALGGFSGGMRQRFGIAQALLASPRLLIVDEPTAGLDPAERIRLQNLLSELAADRIVLLSTHIVEDVQALCADIAVMCAGRIVCRGAPDELTEQLRGHVWQLAGDGPPPAGPDVQPISLHVRRGQRLQRLWSPQHPGGACTPVAPELDDVYFLALQRAASAASTSPTVAEAA